ncbi:hypothetical protein [Frondihabitans australicus]|uniref:Uncharacterized protein n=1 Tax=Frondihabitans australicus TaxID=386892 RepID=A0A495IIQ4_9MICO|nr:hypothetical protein [Frondihabitans australicus]RKR75590.1 hypothetical protein C8E83_2738 [Frondihabitans australicus]
MTTSSRTARARLAAIAGLSAALTALALTGCTSTTTHSAASSTPTPHTSSPTTKVSTTIGLTCDSAIAPAVLGAVDPTILPQKSEGAGGYTVAPPSNGPAASGLSASTMTRLGTEDLAGPPTAVSMLAAAQEGFYDCSYIGKKVSFTLDVLPDAATQFAAAKKQDVETAASAFAVPITVSDLGTDQFAGCQTQNPNSSPCEIDVLDGSIWYRVQEWPATTPTSSASASRVAFQLTSVVKSAMRQTHQSGLTPAPMTVAASAWSKVTECSQILPGSRGATASSDLTDAYDIAFADAVAKSGSIGCYGSAGAVFALPGGGSVEPFDYAGSDYSTPVALTLAGVTDARYVCAHSGAQCWAEGVVDGALVVASNDGQAQAQDSATLAQVGKALAAL